MDHWTKTLREDKSRPRTRNPSFSSSLLDAIYRSIDEGEEEEEELVFYKETMKKKQTTTATATACMKKDTQVDDDYRRSCLIEKWMEKKTLVRRNTNTSTPDLNPKRNGFHSASSSSDSSSAGGFSSSEAESAYGSRIQKPKPIRTKPQSLEFQRPSIQKPDGGFNQTKSKALKIYGDLKKVKQPISPGGKLASFLNSLFTNSRKDSKLSTSVNSVHQVEDLGSERKSKSTQTSTCSSASSLSRSCLSKTPSSSRKSSTTNATKRSVRFYPVSVIVDEDSRPCGHKTLDHYQQQQHRQQQPPKAISVNEELKLKLMEKNRKIEEAAREYLKCYQEKKIDVVMRDYRNDEDDNDGSDAESYASSDLFELDNFAAIGIERYREELPVYETTHLDKNRAISNQFIL